MTTTIITAQLAAAQAKTRDIILDATSAKDQPGAAREFERGRLAASVEIGEAIRRAGGAA